MATKIGTENEVNRAKVETLEALTGLLKTLRDLVLDARDVVREDRENRKVR